MQKILGDIDLDGSVTFDDFLVLAEEVGKVDAGWAEGDLSGDAKVDFDDFLLLAENFGKSAQPQGEPLAAQAHNGAVDLAFATDDEEDDQDGDEWELA